MKNNMYLDIVIQEKENNIKFNISSSKSSLETIINQYPNLEPMIAQTINRLKMSIDDFDEIENLKSMKNARY